MSPKFMYAILWIFFLAGVILIFPLLNWSQNNTTGQYDLRSTYTSILIIMLGVFGLPLAILLHSKHMIMTMTIFIAFPLIILTYWSSTY